MCTVLPEICGPVCELALVTITAMNSGSGPAGGGVLLPGSVLQSVPHAGATGLMAKPLKLAGPDPPLSAFTFHQLGPQKVTAVPIALLPSPITNAPPSGAVAKISTRHPLTETVLPPSSPTATKIDSGPVAL